MSAPLLYLTMKINMLLLILLLTTTVQAGLKEGKYNLLIGNTNGTLYSEPCLIKIEIKKENDKYFLDSEEPLLSVINKESTKRHEIILLDDKKSCHFMAIVNDKNRLYIFMFSGEVKNNEGVMEITGITNFLKGTPLGGYDTGKFRIVER